MNTPSIDRYEKLASFYLGRHYDLSEQRLKEDLLMYDAKDLCTHAVCVGMTGSGKTGLGLALLEEAAIDGIPAICVDPKGDLANLLLTFPTLESGDFLPWVDAGEAARKGLTPEQLADQTAERWRAGLASWGISPDRIERFRDHADVVVYTPGSNAGLPLTVLRSFDAPPPETLDDTEAMRQQVSGAASALLTLLGIAADPLQSREHILISSIFEHCWRQHRSVSLTDLIGLMQRPPINQLGVLDLESFMPSSERGRLAMQLNNLLASPAFAAWLEGDSLSIKRLLHTPEGKPRLVILSIAHLNDSERMFFVTILLNELLAWTRAQSGTSSLRALFYMDEIAGYFPPVSIPPSKPPMLTLLKQARAFGLGIVLATQNPADLDYKGLANIGTWFIGRLQTDNDKARMLDGLEGASAVSGAAFDRQSMSQMISGLGNRIFLMRNVHDDGPVLFQTRWVMSFLAGPLVRTQIASLMAERKQARTSAAGGLAAEREKTAGTASLAAQRPVVATGITERFLSVDDRLLRRKQTGAKLVYRPAVLGVGSLHYVRASAAVDHWIDYRCLLHCEQGIPQRAWEDAMETQQELSIEDQPHEGFTFTDLPVDLRGAKAFKRLESLFKDYLYRHHVLTLYRAPLLRSFAPAGLDEGEARVYFTQELRELRDRETEAIRLKYAAKAQAIEKAIRTAGDRLARQQADVKQAAMTSAMTLGASVLGAFFGNKSSTRAAAARTNTIIRSTSAAAKKRADSSRAEQTLRELQQDLRNLESTLQSEMDQLIRSYNIHAIELEPITVSPRKSDLKTQPLVLLWTPGHDGGTQHGAA